VTRPKLADVARLAGVGIGTASDALSGKNRIPDDTRERVRQAARSLGYVPNPVARALSAGRLPVIGLVITALRHPAEFEPYRTYWGELIGAASLAATDRGYAVTVLPGLGSAMASSLPVSGLIVITTHEDDDDLEHAFRLGVPVVGDGFVEDPRAAGWVDLDYAAVAPLVMDHFVACGATRPSLLWGVAGDEFLARVDDAQRRWSEQHGLPVISECTDPSNDRLHAAIAAVLDQRTDAILTVVESVPEIVAAIEARGLQVGRDVRVVTLDEDVAGRLADDGISTVGLTGRLYADEVVGALIDVIEGSATPPITIVGDPTLHPRRSSTGMPTH
jgi:DNA-binding LacI/PurR family transcriptional regulator